MLKKQFKQVYSIFSIFLMLFQTVAPAAFLVTPAYAATEAEVTVSNVTLGFNADTNEFTLSGAASASTEYVLTYNDDKDETPEEAVLGTVDVSDGTFSKTIYAGTCSGADCVAHEVVSGVLKFTATGYQADFTLVDGVLWLKSGSVATVATVETGKTYVAPQNEDVTVTFATLPETAGFLSIEEIILSDEQVEAVGAYSKVAYDITSNMDDGTFEYELKLPLPEGADEKVGMVYAENVAELTAGKAVTVESDSVVENEVVATGLDHFTVFVVTDPNTTANCDMVSLGTTTGSTCFATIQEAVAAANDDEDVINVAAGTYYLTEILAINKNISIIGHGSVIIKADNASWPTANSTKHLVDVFGGTSADPVSIINITFDSNNQAYGIQAYGDAYLSLNDVTLENSKGAGMTVNGSNVTATNLNTNNNAWGSVNVDPGSGVTTPSVFVLNGGILLEAKKIWSDGDYVGVSSATATVDVTATGYTGYVDTSTSNKIIIWTNSPVDLSGKVTIVRDEIVYVYSTIQSAVDDAVNGETINVIAGTFTLSNAININKSVTLLGAQRNVDPRPSEGGRTGDETVITGPNTLFSIDADNVEINGFSFVSTGTNNSKYVVYSLEQTGTSIKYNKATSNSVGMDEMFKVRKCVSGCSVTNNYIHDMGSNGDAIGFDSVTNGIIQYNEVSNNSSANAAIYVYDSSNTLVDSNLVYDIHSNDAIKLGRKNGGDTGTGVTVSNNVTYNLDQDGIAAYMQGVSITGNTIYNSNSANGAIHIQHDAIDVVVSDNTIYNNNTAGIRVGSNINDVSAIQINNNDIYDNAIGLSNASTDTTNRLNATQNWWGDDTGPIDNISGDGSLPETNTGSGNSVVGRVDYQNWTVADTTAPEATIDNVAPVAAYNGTAGLSVHAIDDNYLQTEFYRNGETSPFKTYTGAWFGISWLPDNEYKMVVIDTAGNTTDYEFIIDRTAPEISTVKLNDQTIASSDIRHINCEAVQKFYPVSGEIDLSAVIEDSLSDVESARYNVRKVNSNGCTVTSIYKSGTITMVKGANNTWNGTFDTRNTPADGEYTIQLITKDSVGNEVFEYIDILVDNTAPEATIDNASPVAAYNSTAGLSVHAIDDNYLQTEFYRNGETTPFKTYTGAWFGISWLPDNEYKMLVIDTAGNTTEYEFIIDRIAPEITIDSIKYPNGTIEPSKFVTNYNTPVILGSVISSDTTSVVLSVNGFDYTATIDGGVTAWEATISDELPDGEHTMTVVATDAAGNTKSFEQKIVVDTNAPTADHTYYKDDVVITESIAYGQTLGQFSFTGDYSDLNPSSNLFWDSFVIFQAQDDGSFRFAANGKQSYCGWRSAPNLVNLSGSTFGFTTPVNFTECTADLADGEYYMAHHIYDSATRKDIPSINQFRDVLGLHFMIDTVNPSSEITVPLNDFSGDEVETNSFDGHIEGTATDATSGVKEVNLEIMYTPFGSSDSTYWNGSDWQVGAITVPAVGTSTWKYDIAGTLDDGIYDVTSHATDNAGNVESTYTIKIVYDKTIPEVVLTIDPASPDGDNGWYRFTEPTITLEDSDNYEVGDIEFQWNTTTDGNWTTYSGPFNPPNEGQNILYYRAIDKVGNVMSPLGVKEVKYDTTNPAGEPLNVRVENITADDADGIWEAPEDDSDVHHYTLSWKHEDGDEYGATVSHDTFEHVLDNLKDGAWTFTVRAVDAAGNFTEKKKDFRVGPGPSDGNDDAEVFGVTDTAIEGDGIGGAILGARSGNGSSQEDEKTADEGSEKTGSEEEITEGEVLGATSCSAWKYYLPLILLALQLLAIVAFEFMRRSPGMMKLGVVAAITLGVVALFYFLKDTGCYVDGSWLAMITQWFPGLAVVAAVVTKLISYGFIEEA